MTALAGIWRFDGRQDAATACGRMLNAQEVYGPDDGDQWSGGRIALGRRLMRILPEDKFDHQPLIGGSGRYVLVADTRLDNREELIADLGIETSKAGKLCDAGLLLTAFERWGENCFEHLVGDYAFAVWDGQAKRLLLARDPLGQLPLHFHRTDKFFAFASMPKGLHALPEIPYGPDEQKIAECLVLIPEHGSRTFFKDIERVEPGQVVAITQSGIRSRRHWQPAKRDLGFKRPEEFSDALAELLDEAVRCRLRGAQDVGVYLSGGFDSGIVATTAARLLAPSGGRVVAFTGAPRQGYDGPSPRKRIIDETPYAAATAALCPNIEHVVVHNEGRSPLEDLDRTFFLNERPFVGLCHTSWSHSFGIAVQSRKLKVCLGGYRGNMGLSYDGIELLPELLRSGRLIRLWREAKCLVDAKTMRWRGVLAQTFGPWCPVPVWVWLNKAANGYALALDNYSAINPQRLTELELATRARRRGLDFHYRPWKDGLAKRAWILQATDLANYRKGALAGWQIDTRDPTADVRLLEFCFSVPTEQFLSRGVSRALARRSFSDRLPKIVMDEKRRGLQVADWHEDLNSARDQVEKELDRLAMCPSSNQSLDISRLKRLTKDWPSDGWERDDVVMPYRYMLLRAIAAGHFLRRATGSNC